MTKLIRCTCRHDYQDKKYGRGRRIANIAGEKLRCTVCAREHFSSTRNKKGK